MPRRLKVTDVNPHVACTLCDGYLVDATAIIECLHAFCRTCIVRYLENSKFCPVCDVQVHKTKPLLSIRSDQTLQDLVYKVVPELYQNEMHRRREFYAEHPKAASGRTPEERGEGEPRFFSPKETISLSLQHLKSRESKSDEQPCTKDPMTRHLNCPAAFTVGHLKKFIHLKFSLPPACEVDVFYDDHVLRDHFTLMDVAYIYSWKRAEPMKFFYSIAKRVPKYIEPPPLPPPPASEAVLPPEAVCSDKGATDDVPQVLPVVAKVADAERMEVDSESPVAETGEVEVAPPVEVKVDTPELDSTTSSKDDVQIVDVSENKHPFNSSLPIKSNLAPLVPEPTYNSVKVVSAPEPNTLLSPTNGFRLKFIHDPELNPKKSSSKKSGRKGRSSRHKNAPVRLARLAPYPPPPAPVTCLTTPQHLSQLTVGKLVPSVITTLAPTFVTTLVSTTSNSACSNVTNNASSVSNFLGQSSAVCTITTPNALLAPRVLPSTAENAVTLSSTANTVTVSACSLGPAITTQQNSPRPTKELLGAEASPVTCSVPSSAPSTTTTLSVRTDVEKSAATINFIHSSVTDASALTNSIVDSRVNVPDSSLSPSPTPVAVVSSSTKDADGSEIVTSTSGDAIGVPVSTPVPIPHVDSDARGAFRETTPEDAKSTSGHTCRSAQHPELERPATSLGAAIALEDEGGLRSLAPAMPNQESAASQRCHESPSTSGDLDSKNASTQESVPDKTSAEPFSSFNGHDDTKSRLSPKESTPAVDNKHSKAPFQSIVAGEAFKESVDVRQRPSLEAMVKEAISAEFSDNDDLGCQSDLVVDEQKAGDSSENEEEDAALRKKINAIAEKEDETDDTEADSGRASDMSCPARCEEDVGSPMATDVAATAASHHHTKSNHIDHVIKQIYLQHEIARSPASPKPAAQQQQPTAAPQRDDLGALDLSTCTRKPGEMSVQGSRPRPVANPVLDTKHRQQTYMPAPVRQHTACVPTPKHPTTSPLLMHQLTTHPPSILQAQLTGKSLSSHHHHVVPYSPYPMPTHNRTVSSPSPLAGRPSPPSYSYRFAHHQGAAPQQGGSVNLLAGMLPYASGCLTMTGGMAGFAAPPRPSSTSSSHRKDVSSPPTSSGGKTCSSSFNSHIARDRKNWSSVSSSRKLSEALLSGGPNCRLPAALPTSPTGIPAHPRTSPSMPRMSPHHRSASPAPNHGSPSATTPSTAALVTSTSSTQAKQSVPIYKKSDSFKGFNKFKRSANLAVFNPDPNGYRQKLVIKNLDFRSNAAAAAAANNNSNHHHHHHH